MLTIGYVSNVKKNKQFYEPFVNFCHTMKKDEFKCVEVFIEKKEEIENQPKVDILFFKVTDDMVIEEVDLEAHERLENLRKYINLHKNDTLIMEPLESIQKFLKRTEIQHFLEKELNDNELIHVPKVYLLNNEKELTEYKFVYPLVCKTVAACGKSETHHMSIVFNFEQLEKEIKENNSLPIIAQQYINHDATLLKMYVIGDRVFYQIKPSLKNFEENHPIIHFDSQKPFDENISNNNVKETALKEINYNETEETSFDKRAKIISHQLRKSLGVSLFGFDLLRDASRKEDHYYVVDVNYFPSYKGVSREILFDYILEHIKQRYLEFKSL
ncbi:hypothetical protein ABK040_010090 [Willaertia magna]